MKRITFFTVLLTSILLAACSRGNAPTASEQAPGKEVPVAGGSYTDISVSDLQTMLENKDFPLINVHIPFEGDLPNTDNSIPFDQIADHLDQLPQDKDAKIVLYCRSGRMSSIAAETLVGLGYTDVYNLDGGFNAWEKAGLPIVGR